MSADLTPFDFDGQSVRVVTIGNEPWFVAADVTALLGYNNGRMAISNLPDRMRNTVTIRDGIRGNPERTVLNEAGVNRLIMRSTLPEAERIQDWLAEVVMPSIRRTGGYLAPVPDLDELEVAERYVTALREKRALTAEVVQLTPRAQAWDVMVSAGGDYAVDEAAKILSRDPNIEIGRQRLFTLMGDLGWIYRQGHRGRWHAYQTAIETGRLSERASAAFLNARTGEMEAPAPTIRVTTKGLDALRERLTRQEAS